MKPLIIFGFCLLLVGCVSTPSHQKESSFDAIPWRWADHTNRVWVSVSGVGVEDRESLKKIKFSYSPNSGKSANEAIAISAFNMFTGRRAEELLLRVLFGMNNVSKYSEVLADGKMFHVYSFTTTSDKSDTIYFDSTMYHNLW